MRRNTREHHLNFLDSFGISSCTSLYRDLKTVFFRFLHWSKLPSPCPPLFSPTCTSPGGRECSWPEAQGGHFELSVSYFCRQLRHTEWEGPLFLGYWGYFGHVRCSEDNPPQRQVVLLVALSFNNKREKLQGCEGLCQRKTHSETAFLKIECREQSFLN